jgi:arylsulfatase A-like enzyme
VRETQPVAGVDVMPLVLDALGLSWPDAVQGRVPGPERPVLAEVNPIAPRSGLSSWRALWRGRHKLLAGSRGERQLFDLETDPGELDDLAPERPDELRALERELAAAFDALPLPPRDDREIHVDRATREALRAMGYLEGQGAPAPENADPETR